MRWGNVLLEIITKNPKAVQKRLLEGDEDAQAVMKSVFRQVISEYEDTFQILLTPEINKQLNDVS